MSPPIEPLIRDYLSRLSAAARGQLSPADRKALVGRARNLIETRTSGPGGSPTAVEVAQLLSRLGDPVTLVRREKEQLATLRGGALATDSGGRPGRLGRLSSSGRLGPVVRGLSPASHGTSWHWPAQPAGNADLQSHLLSGSVPGPAPAEPLSVPRQARNTDSRPGVRRPSVPSVVQGTVIRSGSESPPGQADEMSGPTADRTSDQMAGRGAGRAGGPRARWPYAPASGSSPDAQPGTASQSGPGPLVSGPSPSRSGPDASQGSSLLPLSSPSRAGQTAGMAVSPTAPADSGELLSARILAVATSIGIWARRQPLEAAAVTLLGLGGVIFPPVWLLGAAVTLGSRLWDYRDKWLGLAGPVLITIVGTVAGVAASGDNGMGHSVHEGWVAADIVSRLAAAVGAAYLAWRSVHDRHPPEVPPWNKARKVG